MNYNMVSGYKEGDTKEGMGLSAFYGSINYGNKLLTYGISFLIPRIMRSQFLSIVLNRFEHISILLEGQE